MKTLSFNSKKVNVDNAQEIKDIALSAAKTALNVIGFFFNNLRWIVLGTFICFTWSLLSSFASML